jgi:hypothetical protein
MASPASTVILPMQDVLGLDQRARMNIPGTLEGNWSWRLQPMKLDKPARLLRTLADSFDRHRVSGRALLGPENAAAAPHQRLEKAKAIKGRDARKGIGP